MVPKSLRIEPNRTSIHMKKLIPLLLIVSIVIFGALIFKNIITSNVIILKDNTRIVVDETWVVGDKVFFKTKDKTDFVPIDKVHDIRQGGLSEGSDIALFMQKQIDSGRETASEFMDSVGSDRGRGRSLIMRWAPVLIGILVCVAAAVFILRKRKSLTPPEEQAEKQVAAPAETREEEPEYTGQEIIVQHFLKIFKAQKGADDDAPATLRRVGSRSPDGNYIYELRVKLAEEWTSRRMTLGPIGEDSGSRSRCYYIIYDDHIVVKVPPYPVTNFKTYLQRLQKEAGIANRLAPRECLVPRISVILKKVHPFHADSSKTPEVLEKEYITWIKDNQQFREFLKIDGAYAYFMDLSKYFFLGSILDNMHNPQRNIPKEIMDHPEILWDNMTFEARYGRPHSAVFDEMQPIYNTFENRVKEFLLQNAAENAVQNFQIREWFLVFLADGKMSAADLDMKSGMASGLNGIANKLFKEKRKPVEAYRNMIASYVVNKGLTRNKSQISSMITNLFDLLAWLHHKKVAMRDLKPDNLLVAGDPTKFPQFLESASLYSIGLIDVETAAWLETEGGRQIDQPLLGGTPSFATPTHTFTNKAIRNIYGDPALILHLQDWYAAIAMVYHMVTGKRLFTDTARVLMKIKPEIKEGVNAKSRAAEVLGKASRTFWSKAVAEFDEKVSGEEKKLKYVSMIMTADARDMLLPIVSTTLKDMHETIKRLILEQKVFKNEKLKKSLYSASYMKVSRFREKVNAGEGTNMAAEEKTRALALLDELEALKRKTIHLIGPTNLLNKPAPIISAYDLLLAMFAIVLTHMHENVWGVLKR